MPVDPAVKSLATGRNFGALAYHRADGSIANHVMWVDADDEHLLINTEVHRGKFKAMTKNPDVTVTIWDSENPYHYAEVRGAVVGTDDSQAARDHIDALSQRYNGGPYGNPIQSRRVIVKIEPVRQRVQ